MKRKAAPDPRRLLARKRTRTALPDAEAKLRFHPDLFDAKSLASYTAQYSGSAPYKHAVIHPLVDDALLRQVRDEIRSNVSFTPKETDIYRIHQSGDLANLDGLDDAELTRLPSLLRLRDALYSDVFRRYVAAITGCGPLSGTKTDMAVNVYTPGCFLLCHDDVIGSRKVSYILYLTDPDDPWQPAWGGALRLYPTEQRGEAKSPTADPCRVIPPAWNQLSFFAVQPGESFHDVEEVHHPADGEDQKGSRVRMAISGWFHIPQNGEEGFEEGAEERLAKNSSLMQLSGNPDQYDLPRPRPVKVASPQAGGSFGEADLEFLIKYLAPTYLTPDTLEQMAGHFEENSSITLSNILSKKFAARLRAHVAEQEARWLPDSSAEIEATTPWRVARPPHKHRFLYQQPARLRAGREQSPITELLEVLLPSRQFRQWLQLATGCTVVAHEFLARRFRRGSDYTLATGHHGKAQLEINLGFTPTTGWGDVAEDGNGEEEDRNGEAAGAGAKSEPKKGERANGTSKKGKPAKPGQEGKPEEEVGGHEVYMAGDDDDEANDAAIYRSGGGDDVENILFFQAAAWNKMTIVLRDSGTLRFIKYVTLKAKGDRWDILGIAGIEDPDDEGGEDGENAVDESEEEFRGFSDSPESDSA